MITADSSLSPLVKPTDESNLEEQNTKGYKEVYGGWWAERVSSIDTEVDGWGSYMITLADRCEKESPWILRLKKVGGISIDDMFDGSGEGVP